MTARQIPEHERMRPPGIPVRKGSKVAGIVIACVAFVIYLRTKLGPGGGRLALALIALTCLALLIRHELRRDRWLATKYDLMLGLVELLRWPTERKITRLYWPFKWSLPGEERVIEPVDPSGHVTLDMRPADTLIVTHVPLGKRARLPLRRHLVLTFDPDVAAAIDHEADEVRSARGAEKRGRYRRRDLLDVHPRRLRDKLRSRRQSRVRLSSIGHPRRCWTLDPVKMAWFRNPRWWPHVVTHVRLAKVPPAFPWHERKTLDKIAAQVGHLLGLTFTARGNAPTREIILRATLPLPATLDYDELPAIVGKVVIARAEPDEENAGITWFDNVAYVAFDPNEFPHGRIHGPTGRGKTVLLRAFVYAWWRYGARLVLIDGKRAGSFVYFLVRRFAGRCDVPGVDPDALRAALESGNVWPMLRRDIDLKLDTLRAVYEALLTRQVKLELVRHERRAMLDDGVPESDLPPLPSFEPLTVILDEFRALSRDCDLLDERDKAEAKALGNGKADLSGIGERCEFLRLFAAQTVQLGRELGVFLYIASQTAQVEGVGGAKLDSETRSQFTLVGHLGPVGNTSDATTVFGSGDGISAWALSLNLKPYGRGGVKLGDALIRCHFPYSHDPLAALAREATPDVETTYSAVLDRLGREQTAARAVVHVGSTDATGSRVMTRQDTPDDGGGPVTSDTDDTFTTDEIDMTSGPDDY